jgi:hypothetical protein
MEDINSYYQFQLTRGMTVKELRAMVRAANKEIKRQYDIAQKRFDEKVAANIERTRMEEELRELRMIVRAGIKS